MLYSAHERRWKAEEQTKDRVNAVSIKQAGMVEGTVGALKSQVERLEQQLGGALEAKALAEAKAESQERQCESHRSMRLKAEQEQAAAGSEVAVLREEVARLRVADIGEMESAWAAQVRSSSSPSAVVYMYTVCFDKK